jgi:O-acetyl-ADP-ribose deacetylase (regulator of RNase III)
LQAKYQILENEIELIIGDITDLKVDAVVNAANENLILGGGVAGAIRIKGGESIQEECNKIGGTSVGGAVITTGGNLPATFVIHAVGPRMGEGNEDQKLKEATLNSLKLAGEKELRSLAFPAISTGIFGFPIERCSHIMTSAALEFMQSHKFPQKIIFCLWSKENFNAFKSQMDVLINSD